MISTNLKNKILFEPIEKYGANQLYIVSGYATPSMAAWHMQAIKDFRLSPININLVVGMCPFDGLSLISHKGFLSIQDIYTPVTGYSKFACQYVFQGSSVHSKLYAWLKDGTPVVAFIGSANYSLTAFGSTRRELMIECAPEDAMDYLHEIEGDAICCDNSEINNLIRFNNQPLILDVEGHGQIGFQNDMGTITLSLLSRTGDIGIHSGLNWGQRDGRDPNEAYIPLPSSLAKSGFFPINRQHFSVITDDNKSLILRVEQAGNKAITTPENNSRLGEYFRNRLGLPNGAPILKEDLERYGRTSVCFVKFDEEQFYMDFSL